LAPGDNYQFCSPKNPKSMTLLCVDEFLNIIIQEFCIIYACKWYLTVTY
jgi:hypothetical protein